MKEISSERPNSKELAEYFELLKFQTVGADPMHLRSCVQCAMWLKKWLEGIGADAQLLLPQGESVLNAPPPVVFAERPGDEGAPTVLFYGHYDVQPPDPIEEWNTSPFEPTEKDGRVYCRGAQDDKGQFFSFLCGLRVFLEEFKGSVPKKEGSVPTFKFLFEGQEESGSAAIAKIAADLNDRLRADVLLVCDTSAAADLQPAIVAGLRG